MLNVLPLVAMVTCIFVVLVKFIRICLKAYMVWKQSLWLIFFTFAFVSIKGVVSSEVLTRDGAKVEVVPYDLLELVIQRALLKLQTEVVT